MLTQEVRSSIDKCILCWLATSSPAGQPNVSPKEVYTYYGNDEIIIANIASPQSVKNIKQNPLVCVSFVDVLVQKGYQVKGNAKVMDRNHPDFGVREKKLLQITKGKFPFVSLTRIKVSSVKPIIAPSYIMYPDTTTEESQIDGAKKAYGL